MEKPIRKCIPNVIKRISELNVGVVVQVNFQRSWLILEGM